MSTTSTPYNYVADLIAYDNGELDHDGVVRLFQYLLDTELVWHLQGSYQRAVLHLMETGEVVRS